MSKSYKGEYPNGMIRNYYKRIGKWDLFLYIDDIFRFYTESQDSVFKIISKKDVYLRGRSSIIEFKE